MPQILAELRFMVIKMLAEVYLGFMLKLQEISIRWIIVSIVELEQVE